MGLKCVDQLGFYAECYDVSWLAKLVLLRDLMCSFLEHVVCAYHKHGGYSLLLYSFRFLTFRVSSVPTNILATRLDVYYSCVDGPEQG